MNKILQSNNFSKIYKKLQRNIKDDLNLAIKKVSENPAIGNRKHGDLKDIYVYKFKVKTHLYLLAYKKMDQNTIFLEAFGSHENFYKKIKK